MIKRIIILMAILGMFLAFTACSPVHDDDAVDEDPLEETLPGDEDENGDD
jgi:hypothetical protein